jgi:Mrp family chromosome partitioning ATPase
MNRMHKALENLRLEGQKASRIQQSRRAIAPRVAAALRSKIAGSTLFELPAPPSLLFSAPLLAGHENDVLSVGEKQLIPVELIKRTDAPPAQGPVAASIAILGDDVAELKNVIASREDQNNAVFASLAQETGRPLVPGFAPSDKVEQAPVAPAIETPVAADIKAADAEPTKFRSTPSPMGPLPVAAAADMLMNAIVLKRPTRTFRSEHAADQMAPAEVIAESIQPVPPPAAQAENKIQATDWEREASQELADPTRYGQYAELLRGIRRDLRAVKSPVVACCSIDADGQTTDVIHRLATIASKGVAAKVLMVDGNQATSRMTSELNLDDSLGMIHALSRDTSIDGLVRSTSQAGIFAVPLGSGSIENLGMARKRLAALVKCWKQDYTMVFVDVGAMSSPLAALLCAGCDGAYVSVQLGATLAAEAERRIKQFRADGVNLLGCIALQPQ